MIVSVTGLIGSGKDTIADFLCQQYQFRRFSFASTLKDAISSVFNWDRDLLEGSTKESRIWREQLDVWWSERLGMNITPRIVLQQWGTEVCRNNFHQDIWVASLENKLRNIDDDIVVTDCRFQNEINTIKKLKGITIRVEREPNPDWYNDAIIFNKGPDHENYMSAKKKIDDLKIHPSEYSSIGLEFDYVVYNNSTISDLHSKIKSIINL